MHTRLPALGVILALFLATSAAPPTLMDPRTPAAAEVAREAVLQGSTSNPAVVSWGAGRLHLFVRGSDATLMHKAYDNGLWTPWESLGGGLASGSGPAVASFAAGHLDVFIRGTDNALWHRYFVNNAWSGWESLGGGITSDPAAVSNAPGRLDVFARGTDNALWHRGFAGAWGNWSSLGGSLVSGPAVSSWGPERLDVFVRGADNTLQHTWYDRGWSGVWESLGGALSSDPAAVSWGAGRIDVFAKGTDGVLKHKWYEGGWSAWENLGGGGGVLSGPDVSTWGNGRLDVFARVNGEQVSQLTFAGSWNTWKGVDVNGFPVSTTGPGSALVVSWPAIPNAASYQVARVKPGDACCNTSMTVTPPATSTTDAVSTSVAATYQYTVTTVFTNTRATLSAQTSYTQPVLETIISPRSTILPTGPAPVVTSRVLDYDIGLDWPAVTGAETFHVFRDGVELAGPVRCAGCSYRVTGLRYGGTYALAVESRFPASSGLRPGRWTASVTIPARAGPAPVVTVRQDLTSILLEWPAVAGTDSFHVFRNGVDLATVRCAACSSRIDGGSYGTIYAIAVESRFPTSPGLQPGRWAANVPLSHVITVPTTPFMVTRGGRVNIPITNTANPDGTLGGLVTGTGNGILVNDPGRNTLAMIASNPPLGPQDITLNGPAGARAVVHAVVTPTPGQLLLVMPGVTSRNAASSTTALRVAQLDSTRWTATFGALAPLEFTRERDLGGAEFCINSDAFGVVVSADGPRLGLGTDWAVRLLDLKGGTPPHLLAARHSSTNGRVNLVPMVYTSPDCSVVAIVDVNTENNPAYRVRIYDLLHRRWLDQGVFDAPSIQYSVITSALTVFSTTVMRLATTTPAGTLYTQVMFP